MQESTLVFLFAHGSQITMCFWLLCFTVTDDTRGHIASGFLLLFHRPRSSVYFSEFALRKKVSQHLCDVVLSGALGAPDLCSAADPGADRWFVCGHLHDR